MKLLSVALLIVFCLCPVVDAEQPGIFDEASPLKLVHQDFELADGAGWDGQGKLFVPDVKGKRLLEFDLRKPEEAPRVRLQGAAISGCCYQLGQLYLSDNGNSRIATLGKAGEMKTLAQFDAKQRPNDLVVDAYGNVYVTFTREGVVRRISPAGKAGDQEGQGQGEVKVVVDNLVTPNGIALSPDGSTLYVSSAKTGVISRATVGAASPWAATEFARLAETADGFRGDGMCVDRAGNVYCTGAETVTVFDSEGRQIDQLKTPERPINAIIGGVDGRTLFASTFGGLYSQRVNAYGVSPNRPKLSLPGAPMSTGVDYERGVTRDLNVVYANVDGRKLLIDVFTPSSNHRVLRPAILVVHGGGWAKGDKTKFRELAVRLARLGWVTACIEYRLAFEAKFPAAIQDCNAATSYLRENAQRWGIDPDRIGAVGGSAGGHLVGLMASGSGDERLRHPHIQSSAKLKAVVVMAGPLQVATGSVADRSHDLEKKSNAVNWIGETIDANPEMYALAYAYEKIDANMPPTLFVSGSLDNPDRNEQSREKMKRVGVTTGLVVHPEAKHGHWNRPEWIATVVADLDVFLANHL